MDPTLFPALVLLAVVLLLIASVRDPPSFIRQLRDHLEQLGRELDRRFDRNRLALRLKVYSAETIHGKEAEFIRERLPRKAPRALAVLLLIVVGVIVWWLARS
jgi:hypothetical protein